MDDVEVPAPDAPDRLAAVAEDVPLAAPRGEEEYAAELGERLRNVRQQQDLSLHDVEERSEGELKASVVGAYERGERAVSVARLRSLATFYGVPVSGLLPSGASGPAGAGTGDRRAGGRLVLDLTALDHPLLDDEDTRIIGRYIATIQARRGDYNGRVLTIRHADVRVLAAVLARDERELRAQLVDLGVARAR